jgi:uncharacterized protein YfaS (alpha-2-macroglobulin family)
MRMQWMAGLVLAGWCAGAAQAAPVLGISSFVPQGDARGARQALLRFATPMVAFGDPRAGAPATLACPVPGTGRWLDERTWVVDFDRPLPAGLECTVTAAAGLRSLDGARLPNTRRFFIRTGGPAITGSEPGEDAGAIDEQQLFFLRTDGEVDAASVARHGYCAADGIAETIPLRVIDGDERARALAALERNPPYWLWNPERGARGPRVDRAVLDALVTVSCARPLPPERDMRLVWGRGIASPSGVVRDSDQVLAFTVRPAFVIRTRCQRVNRDGSCLPVTPIGVEFTAPVSREAAASIALVDPASGTRYASDLAGRREATVDGLGFAGPFPPGAKLQLEVPAGLADDAGRPLANADRFPLTIPVDEAPPLAKFAATFGILERKARPALPVTLRNLGSADAARPAPVPGRVLTVTSDEEMQAWVRRLNRWRRDQDTTTAFSAADGTRPISVPRSTEAAEVVGIPLPSPGLHVVELASPRLGAALTGEAGKTWYVRSAALVTNLAVHIKRGRERSAIWVTTLDQAKPVGGAELRVRDCDGTVLWSGRTDGDGLAFTTVSLQRDYRKRCDGPDDFFVSARSGDDVAFALTGWDDGIAPWSFELLYDWRGPAPGALVHTVLDRTLVRAGETVHMKHFARQATGSGLGTALQPPTRMTVVHEGSDQQWELPVSFEAGAALTEFAVPTAAKLGRYRFYFPGDTEGGGEFSVQEFRLPAQRATLQFERGPLVAPAGVATDVMVTYLAGGGAAGAPVTLRWRTTPLQPRPRGYDRYSFATETVRTGLVTLGDPWADDGAGAPAGPSTVQSLPLTLDASGSARVTLGNLAAAEGAAKLQAELEYPDANGQRLSVSATTPVYPASVLVGLRAPRWPRAGEAFSVDAVALQLDGTPVAGQAVTIEAYSRQVYSARKRLFGGFYAYENQAEITPLGTLCTATSDSRGRLRCEAKLEAAHEVLLRAVARDAQGREATAVEHVWLADVDAWWGGNDSERIDVIPERTRYATGETARLEARVPFRASTALVTVEREGVLDAWVMPLAASSPNVSVPIRRGHAPNVFVSVLAVRGRVGEPAPTALVDLAKPTFRLGYAALEVGQEAHELDVTVTPDAVEYPTRGTARVAVQVRRPDGTPAADADVLLAAVDEALLELSPNDTVNLLAGMFQQRPLGVATATAQLQVIGKRHYGRKAAPPGGGGGLATSRELFDTLLAWRGRVALDASGRATVEVPLNDSLSSFRLTAVAADGTDLFGTGQASIRTHRDLMLFSGTPEVARSGDVQRATATVRNAADRSLQVEATATLTPLDAAGQPLPVVTLPPQALTLAAGAAAEVAWTVPVPPGAARIGWELRATAPGVEPDALRVGQRVLPGRAEPGVVQATLLRLDAPRTLAVRRPGDALPGVGEVRVALSPSLVGGLDGVRRWFGDYPFDCLEQRVSIAVGLADPARWDAVMAALPAYLDADGLARFWPTERLPGSDTLAAYILQVAHAAGYEIPAATRERMLAGLKAFLAGGGRAPASRRPGDLTLRRLDALEALARYGQLQPALLEPLSVTPEVWPNSALLNWIAILQHAAGLPDRDARLASAVQLLQSRLGYAATRVTLSGERDQWAWWLLGSPDEDAVRALLLGLDVPALQDDLPRLAAGTVGRQQRGAWDTTHANAWGSVAVRRFAERYEAAAVAGLTRVALAEATGTADWATPVPGDARLPAPVRTVTLPWPAGGRGELAVGHDGSGAPWATVQSVAAVPVTKPLFSGYRLRRSVTPVLQQVPGRWTRGDLVRVTLDIEAGQDMAWVAVTDPIPAGSAITGSTARDAAGLAGEAAPGAGDSAWPAWIERSVAGYRAFFDWLPRGRSQVEYVLRLNTAGEFVLPPTRVEGMYAPDVFGLLPNAPVRVEPGP